MYRGGLNFMRFSVSDTAEYGDYVSGPRVAEGVKSTMKDVLTDIQSGAFANRWIAEQESGGAEFRRLREQDRDHQIEQVGADLRAQMPFLNPVVVRAGEAQAAVTGAASGGAGSASGGTPAAPAAGHPS
jgi:ketol-acid reductoisomerase